MTHREELTLKAVKLLNQAKGINYIFIDPKENSNGEVEFTCIYPSSRSSHWSWPSCWFDPEGQITTASGLTEETIAKIDKLYGDDKIVARMIAFLWVIRNS